MVKIVTENEPKGYKRVRTAKQKAVRDESEKFAETAAERRLDTRRKVVIGGALMARAERDEDAAKMLADLKRDLHRDADRKLFKA